MEDLATSIRPIYYISKIFGQANISFTGPIRKRKVAASRRSQIYSVLSHSILTLVSFYIHDIKHDYKEKNSYKIVILLHVNTSIMLLMASVLFNVINIKKQIVIFSKILVLDENLKKMGIYVNHRNIFQHICLLCSTQYILMLGFYVYGWKDHYDFEDVLIVIFIFIRKNARLVTMLQIEIFMLLVKERFKLLENNLRQVAKHNVNKYLLHQIVSRTAKYHQELCWITRSINDIYDVQCLTSTCLTFVTLVMDLFNIISYPGEFTFDNMYQEFYDVFNGITTFMVGVYYCSSAADMGNEMKTILHEIVIPSDDDTLRRLILGFSIQLEHDHLVISAFGFFNADWPLIYAMAGGVTSSLVILIQFKMANE